jgi:putative ABC transport system ATP-binding protein
MSSSDQPLLQLQGVTKVFLTDEVETHALSGIHLEINRGEFISINGPSGCGKSTLLSILGLLDSPSDGNYWLGGKPVADLPLSGGPDSQSRGRVHFPELQFDRRLDGLRTIELPLTYRGLKAVERKSASWKL